MEIMRVNVPKANQPRYRSRKPKIPTIVLTVCSQDLQFIYVISGQEGLAYDDRVLRDSITKRNLKIPIGK